MKGNIYGRNSTYAKERKDTTGDFCRPVCCTASTQDSYRRRRRTKIHLRPIFESMLRGEMTAHLGYESNDHQPKQTTNRRNGSTKKTLKSSVGEIPIESPRDLDGTFNSELIPKRKTDISGIEDKVLSMYAKGMCQRDIADVIDDIYGFKLSAQQISIITNSVIDEMTAWQGRALKKMYTFAYYEQFE